MLYVIAAALIIIWLTGMLASFALNGYMHILLAVALIIIAIRMFQGRKAYYFTKK